MINDSQRDILIRFGKHVEKLRQQKSLSYREVAQRCDIDHANIKKIEIGRLNITLLTIIDLARGLGVEVSELMAY